MSGFLVTYGPDPRVWCESCGGVARLAEYFPHSPRPGDFEEVERLHACGPGPWDLVEERQYVDAG